VRTFSVRSGSVFALNLCVALLY